jgi:hypothetical protein
MPDSSNTPVPDRTDKRVVILFGPGRSGTSSIAGSMGLAGIGVPQPVVGATESHPRRPFEPRWVVGFHKELLDKSAVATLDAGPGAAERAAEFGARPQFHDRLVTWLEELLDEHDQVIIKDPRTVMVGKLWIDTCHEIGVTPSFITMLRHPAEVSGSRNQYYAQKTEADEIRQGAIRQVSGWINVALEAERVTREHARVFVDYVSLLGDWRTQLSRVGDALDLRYDPPITADPHPVDDFLDPSLRRVQVNWDDLGVPGQLRDIGQRLWQAFEPLAAGKDVDPAVFDAIRADYESFYRDAVTLTGDHGRRAQRDARVKARKRLREEIAAKEATAKEAAESAPEPSSASLIDRVRRRVRRS